MAHRRAAGGGAGSQYAPEHAPQPPQEAGHPAQLRPARLSGETPAAGVWIAAAILGGWIADPSVRYVATVPGPGGSATAFLAELVISFGLMSVVLTASDAPRLSPYTGLICGLVVAVYISVEAPVSGMSMNPARSFGPAVVGQIWSALWIYFVAPPLGMLAAAELHLRRG